MSLTVSQFVAQFLSRVSEKCSHRRTTILYYSATDGWKKKPAESTAKEAFTMAVASNLTEGSRALLFHLVLPL